MRSEGVNWNEISRHFGKKANACKMHYAALQEKATKEAWSADMEVALKECYEKRKAEFWKTIANDMGNKCNWKVLENKALELGKKGLKV